MGGNSGCVSSRGRSSVYVWMLPSGVCVCGVFNTGVLVVCWASLVSLICSGQDVVGEDCFAFLFCKGYLEGFV